MPMVLREHLEIQIGRILPPVFGKGSGRSHRQLHLWGRGQDDVIYWNKDSLPNT